MSVGFGFSAGDFIAALNLVGTVIDALRSSGGASSEYRELINELYTLESALLRVKRVELEERQNAEAIALRQAASQCQRTIDRFWEKIGSYQSHLRAEGSGSRVKDGWMKIKWAVCKKEDVARFKVDLRGHIGSIEVLLMTVQMGSTKLQMEKQDRHHRTLADKIADVSVQYMGGLATITNGIANSVQQGKDLLNMTMGIVRTNIQIFQIVCNLQNIITNLPGQVELQRPVYLIDALGKSAHFHLDFIRSMAAFKAVLIQNFSAVESGPKKIEKGEFLIQETMSKRPIDLSGAWGSCFLPGQKVDMSMVFDSQDIHCSNCPACRTICASSEDEDAECARCGLNFRRVIQINDAVKVGPMVSQETVARPIKRKRTYDYNEEMKHYRRIKLIGRRSQLPRESVNLIAAVDSYRALHLRLGKVLPF